MESNEDKKSRFASSTLHFISLNILIAFPTTDFTDSDIGWNGPSVYQATFNELIEWSSLLVLVDGIFTA